MVLSMLSGTAKLASLYNLLYRKQQQVHSGPFAKGCDNVAGKHASLYA
jgi:hypothetical protein